MAYVCVVDDKEIIRESLAEVLTREDHTVDTFAEAKRALVEIKDRGYDLVLTDLKMPGMDGMTLTREVRAAGCDAPIIMMTAYATVSTAVDAMKLGVFDYITKPFEADAVAMLVDRALEHSMLRSENEALRTSVEDVRGQRTLVGPGSTMGELRSQLDRVAASHATVLISGESGTGKELVASYIHDASPRRDRPMLCLNCAALSANLLESELFGHERGAFTGADRTRKGRFELASGGTLLLDEVSEMALPLQAKLLRVLQENEFERVGSSVTRRADVRVIATTNRDVRTWVARGQFREDLFYRLNVLPIAVPPLRARAEDIPVLVDHFVREASIQDGLPAVAVAPAAMDLFMAYEWPGNVRELQNICRRAVTLCGDATIASALIEPWLRPVSPALDGMGQLREGRMLEDMERRLIERTLQRFSGHRAKTASALGMGVRTLGLKLKTWRDEATSVQAATAPAA